MNVLVSLYRIVSGGREVPVRGHIVVVALDDCDATELQALETVHGADPNALAYRLILAENASGHASCFECLNGAVDKWAAAGTDSNVFFRDPIVNPLANLFSKSDMLRLCGPFADECGWGTMQE